MGVAIALEAYTLTTGLVVWWVNDRPYPTEAQARAIAKARGVTASKVVADLLWAMLCPEEAIDRPKAPRKAGGGRKKKTTILEDSIDD
jgi:hypothetical protein